MNRFGNDCFSVNVNGFESSFMNEVGDGFELDDLLGDEDIWRGKSYQAPRCFEARSAKRIVKEKGEGKYVLAA